MNTHSLNLAELLTWPWEVDRWWVRPPSHRTVGITGRSPSHRRRLRAYVYWNRYKDKYVEQASVSERWETVGPRSVDGGRLQNGAHCLVVLLEAELVVETLRGVVLRSDHDEGDVASGAHDLRQTLGQVDAEALAPVLGPRLHAGATNNNTELEKNCTCSQTQTRLQSQC